MRVLFGHAGASDPRIVRPAARDHAVDVPPVSVQTREGIRADVPVPGDDETGSLSEGREHVERGDVCGQIVREERQRQFGVAEHVAGDQHPLLRKPECRVTWGVAVVNDQLDVDSRR